MTDTSTEQERQEFLDQVGHLIADGTIETRSLKRAGISFACGNLHAAFLVWQAARRAPVVPGQKGDYLDGVHIPRLREALTFLGRGNGIGEGEVASNLSEYVNAITRAVMGCKELLRSGAPVVPQFNQVAQKKLNYLLEAGEEITGYAIQNKYGRRGAIDCHGFVYWWQDAAAHQPSEADHIPDAGKMAAKHCDLCKDNGGYYYGKSGNEPCCV